MVFCPESVLADRMLPPRRMLDEVIASLKTVIAPAIADPFPKSQAYMAAVILELVARGLEERTDLAAAKERALERLFADLATFDGGSLLAHAAGESGEARLAKLVEHLWQERERLGEETFAAANQRVRETLRELIDRDLEIAGGGE